jgi:cysteinyl-tRNA synthetase
MNARCVWIIDQQGETMLQAGELPEQWHSPAWRDGIIAAGAASATILQSAKAEHPGSYLYFSGQDFDLHLVNLSYSLALLATTPVGEDQLRTAWMEQLLRARSEIEAVLLGDLQPQPAGSASLVEAEEIEEVVVDEGELVNNLQQQEVTTRKGFTDCMDDDFNTAGALGYLFELVRVINQAKDAGVTAGIIGEAQSLLRELMNVLGLRAERPLQGGEATPFIQLLIDMRRELRQQKLWQLADQIRTRLVELGVLLEDSKDGTTWRWK